MNTHKLFFAAMVAVTIPSAAHAWKPKTHVYLAERALADANDGSIEVRQVDYWAAGSGVPLGNYPLESRIAQALAQHPAAFRAGVLGPDAYPDIMAGQMVIHPPDDAVTGPGADDWLRYIWTQALATNDSETIAFAVGFLAHAAGDMYGHTMVNYYAGGPWNLNPASHNAETHLVVEGYIGLHTPAPSSYDASLSPHVHEFIYRTMVDVTDGTYAKTLYDRKSSGSATLPAIFSTIRDGLSEFLQWYQNELRYLGDQARGAPILERPFWAAAYAGFITVTGPLALYAEAWIDDIDRGLRAWPLTSTRVAAETIFSPNDNCGSSAARDILDEYWRNHAKSMLGVPDVVVSISNFAADVVDALFPWDPFAALEEAILDYAVQQATGKTPDEWCEYITDPLSFIDTASTRHGGGRAQLDTAMSLDTNGYFQWESFTAAYNTVVFIELLMLGETSLRDLLEDLGHPTTVSNTLLTAAGNNAMFGFMKTLDGSRQWNENEQKAIVHADCDPYQDLFRLQLGEHNHQHNIAPNAYTFAEADGDLHQCARVTSISLAPLPNYPTAPYCGPQVMANVNLSGPVGPHGGRVRLDGTALTQSVGYVWAGAGARSISYAVPLEPVLGVDQASVTAVRQRTSVTGNLSVGPPAVYSLRLREDFWEQGWQRRYILDGEAERGGASLVAEVSLDCGNFKEGEDVFIEACPQGPGVCIPITRVEPRSELEIDIELPEVTADGWYNIRAKYLGQGVSMSVYLIAARVVRAEFDPHSIVLRANTQTVQLEVQLASPAADVAENIQLEYFRGISGPAMMTIPVGARTGRVSVTVPAGLTSVCEGTIGVATAVSTRDLARSAPAVPLPVRSALPHHPRARFAFIGLEYGGARTTRCFDWLWLEELFMRVHHMREMLDIPLDVEDRRPVYPQDVREFE